ncbi:ABC transporter ATP-binding protein [Sporichthya polymorpha]|uniref:ABC transporter ATP-binding protein n=1 Tax=Sporichthya polymorpha TaxID=35751 RepID=UPI000368C86A|nr:ABC transporter ATP-binding protein [Sporichthya polymorpha]
MTAVLEAHDLAAGYGSTVVVRDLNLAVSPGEVVALLGPNGAGKTTTLMTLAGAQAPLRGEVRVDGAATTAPLHRRARSGLGLVTETRSVLMTLTVAQNLAVAKVSKDRALELFPELREHLNRRVGDLSGGQQQMLALARALAGGPRVLLADELSLGLAPMVVDRLLGAVRAAADDGVAVLLVEQHVRKVLAVADRVLVMQRGRIEMSGTADEIGSQLVAVQQRYLS